MDYHVSLVGRKDLSGEIYRQLRRGILDGRLRPGDALPPTRTLARSLKVSRTTVTVAYDRLLGEGFVVSRVGSGTFVGARAATPSKQRRAHGAVVPRHVWGSSPFAARFLDPAPFDF